MDLLQLKYFQTVARTEHMTKASHQLKLAQPALSKSVSLLEEELGVKLFDRNGRNIKLNYYGEIFLKRVDSILSLVDRSTNEIKDLAKNDISQINLLVLAGSTMIPNLILEFRKKYPNISFKLHQHQSDSNLDFDLCFTSSIIKSQALNCTTLMSEEVFLGVANSHPLSKFDSVYFEEIKDEDFIVLKNGENFREITDMFCCAANFVPNIVFECDAPSLVHSLVKCGHGIGFISGKSWGMNYDSSVKLLHIKDVKCRRYLELVYPSGRYLSKSSQLFIEFCKEYFSLLNK